MPWQLNEIDQQNLYTPKVAQKLNMKCHLVVLDIVLFFLYYDVSKYLVFILKEHIKTITTILLTCISMVMKKKVTFFTTARMFLNE